MMWNYQRTAVVHRKFINAITLMLQTHNTIGHLFQCHAVMTNEHLDTDYWRVQQLNIEQSLTIIYLLYTHIILQTLIYYRPLFQNGGCEI